MGTVPVLLLGAQQPKSAKMAEQATPKKRSGARRCVYPNCGYIMNEMNKISLFRFPQPTDPTFLLFCELVNFPHKEVKDHHRVCRAHFPTLTPDAKMRGTVGLCFKYVASYAIPGSHMPLRFTHAPQGGARAQRRMARATAVNDGEGKDEMPMEETTAFKEVKLN